MVAVCRMPQVEEASAAKLEELRLGAVSQGREWLSRSLDEMRKEELRVLATAAGVETRSGNAWLPVAELRNSSMKVLEPSTEVGFNQKMCCDMSCCCDRILHVCQTWHHGCDMPRIDKQISSTFVASLEVSVGAVREILRIAHANVRL